jgi:transportin-1
LLPKVIALVSSPADKIAVTAIRCVSELIHADTKLVEDSFDMFLQLLFSRAMDQSQELRKAVCFCIVKLLEYRPEKLEPQLEQVIKYMILCTQDSDASIALEACEFWLVMAEHKPFYEVLMTSLPQLIPTLVARMIYSEEEIEELQAHQNDAHVPDNAQDMKPRHYRGKSHEVGGVKVDDSAGDNAGSGEDLSDDEDGDEDDDEVINQWTLRKCSAAALDILSNVFKNAILDPLLPLLRDRLSSNDWIVRESGILALGAIAEGCAEGITVHLPQLVPYMLTSLRDTVVRVYALSLFASSCQGSILGRFHRK